MNFKTAQENFWHGDFGKDYIGRNEGPSLLAGNLKLFSRIVQNLKPPKNCIEFGANIGNNLHALKLLFPNVEQHAVEINPHAAKQLAKAIPEGQIFQGSIFDYSPPQTFDLVLIKGVLIHLNPDRLIDTYDKLAESCRSHLIIAEYYNPTPVSIPYRGHDDKLFKRDFAGEFLDRHPNFALKDYGFSYRRDPSFPQDDITWFLLERG